MLKRIAIALLLFGLVGCGRDNENTVIVESDNPFGFATEVHPGSYPYCDELEKSGRLENYSCDSAPRPHRSLELYYLTFMKDVGLCNITAYTKIGVVSPYVMVEQFKTQIAKKYGPAQARGGRPYGQDGETPCSMGVQLYPTPPLTKGRKREP